MSRKYIDIGANLCDLMFQGIYNDKSKHPADHKAVLKRADAAGVSHIIITAGDLKTAEDALSMIESCEHMAPEWVGRLTTTIGVHPTNCNTFDQEGSDKYMQSLIEFAERHSKRITALGEFGLDYDRLNYCSKEVQLKYFDAQLTALSRFKLPLFLHSRACKDDFLEIMSRHRSNLLNGCVHSFTGDMDEMRACVDMGMYIGLNGCSLKTPENLEVVKAIPANRILLETDAPWCDIRPTHAGHKHVKTVFPVKKKEKWSEDSTVRGRNEPCTMVQVAEVVAAVRGVSVEELSKQVFDNTKELYFPNDNTIQYV